MRHLLSIVAIVAVMAGCSSERSADSFATYGDRALYRLLLTESMHNVGVILFNDSVISATREYYEQTGDRDRTARAQLHHALVLYERGHRYETYLSRYNTVQAELASLRTQKETDRALIEAAPLDWDDLHRLAAEHLPALLHLLNTSPTVNDKETNVCLLIRLRFIPSEIATLTATSPQTITNMCVRLLLKLFGERGGARDFDARIRSVGR